MIGKKIFLGAIAFCLTLSVAKASVLFDSYDVFEEKKVENITYPSVIRTSILEKNMNWLDELKGKVPKNCGLDLHDLVSGGKSTEIDDHPWTAMIGYTKRKS